MAWFILVVAGILEAGWAVGLKYTQGFTKLLPSILTITAIAASMGMLSWSARTLPIGVAYSVWVGIGSAGAVLLGFLLFQEPLSPARLMFLGLLLASIIGLKATA